MAYKQSIAGYCRISVDTELDNDNVSIENQKNALAKYAKDKYPECELTFFEDRDRSGFSFAQREGYQQMRAECEKGMYDIILFKDSSRFGRSNTKGMMELEFFQDLGITIIFVEDNITNPLNDSNWLKTAMLSLFNEMPVRETSKKVKNVIKNRQKDGNWVCAVPYGYIITDTKKMKYEIDKSAVEPIKMVFELYNQGWGYKKIANHLTDLGFPTPRTLEKERKPESKIKAKSSWSIITIQGILENDFYIGTLRQKKYSRKKINGRTEKLEQDDHIVFENHHEAIIDYKTWQIAQNERKKRTIMNYRGVKIFDNPYSGYLTCGDCNAPMFSMSRRDLAPAYRCGTYHNRGLKGCTSHHIRVDFLDEALKKYITKVRDNSADMIVKLNEAIKNEKQDTKEDSTLIDKLNQMINDSKEELKLATKQRLKELLRKPENEDIINETYDEIEKELQDKIYSCEAQLKVSSDKKNTIIKANRVAKTAIDVFNSIIEKPKLDKHDIDLIIDRIVVFEEWIEIHLKPDIDGLLNIEPMMVVDMKFESEETEQAYLMSLKSAKEETSVNFNKPTGKERAVNVISAVDPLEIFTERDGEVIFKKYSPVGELGNFATQYAESLSKTSGMPVAITDKDAVIAVSGMPKKELSNKKVSAGVGRAMREKNILVNKDVSIIDGDDKYNASVICPIISEGDSIGSVIFLKQDDTSVGEVEEKLAQSAAGFLSRQIQD